MNYLVTGGAGFIGSHLVDSLLADEASVTVVDNFDPFYSPSIKLENLSKASRSASFRLIQADICDSNALDQIAAPYDCIVHLAGKGGVRPSINDPKAYLRVNVVGTENVLEFARRCGVSQFVFGSSSSVYGENPNFPWNENDNVLRPISPYASSKVSGELLGHVYSHLYGIRFIALRFFSVYGPRQRPDLAIRKFAELILADKPIPIFGDGSTSRDYTHVNDIVGGIRRAMRHDASRFELLNLGNHRAVTLMNVIRTLERAIGKTARVTLLPEQLGDVSHTLADVARAKSTIDYTPKVSFEDGVADFVHWLARTLKVPERNQDNQQAATLR